MAKNEKPFIVKTSFGDVWVLGTAFGISAYASEPESYTTLVRGKVSVEREGMKPVVILPGEQVVTFKDGKMIKQRWMLKSSWDGKTEFTCSRRRVWVRL